MKSNEFNWSSAKQLTFPQIILAAGMPSAIVYFIFNILLPGLVQNGIPVMIAWPLVAFTGLTVLVTVALILLMRESRAMGISFSTRLCMKKNNLKTWLISIGLMIFCAFMVSAGIKVTIILIHYFNFRIPGHMPFFLNPEIDPMKTDMSVISPGLNLHHQYWMLPFMAVVLMMNILAEEFYWRAWMLPKLSRFGHGAWIMNGMLFALYHTAQLWLLPVLLIAGLIFAFIFYYSKSIWPSFAGHLVLNFFASIIGIALLILKS